MPAYDFALDSSDLAKTYEHVSANHQFRAGIQLLDALQIAPSSRLLDVGCGTGALAEYAAGITGPGGYVLGIDPLPHRIALAALRARSNLEFRVGNAYELSDFPDQSFDVVYLNAVLHWLTDKKSLALPPAGHFAIITCMDARLDPAKYAGLAEDDAHVISNAGGRASDDAGGGRRVSAVTFT